MDGLIPMVYKSLKRNKTRRQYQCLSPPPSAAAATAPIYQTYNNKADFYINENVHHHHHHRRRYHDYFSREYDDQYVIPGPDEVSGPRDGRHRRCNSAHIGGGSDRGLGLEEDDSAAAKPNQLVRLRSHRMFSCVTGA